MKEKWDLREKQFKEELKVHTKQKGRLLWKMSLQPKKDMPPVLSSTHFRIPWRGVILCVGALLAWGCRDSARKIPSRWRVANSFKSISWPRTSVIVISIYAESWWLITQLHLKSQSLQKGKIITLIIRYTNEHILIILFINWGENFFLNHKIINWDCFNGCGNGRSTGFSTGQQERGN